MSDQIRMQIDKGRATVTLSRPEKKNALTLEMFDTL